MLQIIQLEREALGYRNLRLSLETISDTIILEEPFHIICNVTNCTDKK